MKRTLVVLGLVLSMGLLGTIGSGVANTPNESIVTCNSGGDCYVWVVPA